jgi:hypothetical protein
LGGWMVLVTHTHTPRFAVCCASFTHSPAGWIWGIVSYRTPNLRMSYALFSPQPGLFKQRVEKEGVNGTGKGHGHMLRRAQHRNERPSFDADDGDDAISVSQGMACLLCIE